MLCGEYLAEADRSVFADARTMFQWTEGPAAIAALISVPLKRHLVKERLITRRGAALGSHGIRAKADRLTLGVLTPESLGHDLLPDAMERQLPFDFAQGLEPVETAGSAPH